MLRAFGTCARRWCWYAALLIAAAGSHPGPARADVVYPVGTPSLGAHYDKPGDSITFRVYSSRATAIQLYLYDVAMDAVEKLVVPLSKGADSDIWSATVSVADLRHKGITGDGLLRLPRLGAELAVRPDLDEGLDGRLRQPTSTPRATASTRTSSCSIPTRGRSATTR